ncbi:MAG: hypothetical protein ACLFV7_12960 [Phycisphaerae bacterium]
MKSARRLSPAWVVALILSALSLPAYADDPNSPGPLELELRHARSELTSHILLEPEEIAAGSKILNRPSAVRTWRTHVEDIVLAYATADREIGAVHQAFAKARKPEACLKVARLAERRVNSRSRLYEATVLRLLWARALARGGEDLAAVGAYEELLMKSPGHVGFEAAAVQEVAEIWEKRNRFMYALSFYRYGVKNFSRTYDRQTLMTTRKKVKQLEALCGDPRAVLETTAELMGTVERRLEKLDSKRDTQLKARKAADVLGDLIKTIEENPLVVDPRSRRLSKPEWFEDPNQPGEPGILVVVRKPGNDPGPIGDKPGIGPIVAAGPGDTVAESSSGAKNGKVPPNGRGGKGGVGVSGPAAVSSLRAGGRGENLLIRYSTVDDPDWARLPPREQDRLLLVADSFMSDRDRRAICDYFRRLSSAE